MPHQSPDTSKATAQNTVTGHQVRDRDEGDRTEEPKSYAAPAAGEIDDYMDEGDPSFGAHQGANHTNRELHSKDLRGGQHGAKTREANKRILSGKDPT